MEIAYLTVAIVTIAAKTFSGSPARPRAKPVIKTLGPALKNAGIPESWLFFPIGLPKAAGAAGLLLGLFGVPLVGPAAAIGLVLYFVCALYTHIRVSDYSSTFALANLFLALAVATLTLDLATT